MFFGYESKEKHPIYVSKKRCEKKAKDPMFLSKILIPSCMIIFYIVEKKHFCHYSLQGFSTAEILKRHIKDCFKINSKQRIIMPKRYEYVKFKNHERKINSPFMIHVDFESILVPKDNGKRNPKESYMNKYQKILLAVITIN